MAYRGTRGPSTSNGLESSYLERHNDSLVDELSNKVAALKKVTISIGEDVREQNRLLSNMDDDFDSSKGLLMSTMKRLGIVSRAGVNGELFRNSEIVGRSQSTFITVAANTEKSDVLFGLVCHVRLLRDLLLGKVSLAVITEVK
ncbi:SNARE domain protein [Dictyocaulus viviparus]|uniref:BET1 homolog n=1 Tax=Dictyocaulus viviparus TaxID=29172 RepID=A0A0D8Y3T7_DICVI|nr:SNARE domain protein [Dictyocaulus viviparus]